jgi:hypothetical protein
MPDQYLPRGAQDAMAAARRERAKFQQAIARIHQQHTGNERRRLERQLQEVHNQRMADLRAQRNRAYAAAEQHAITNLCRPKLVNRFGYDSFFNQYRQLEDAPMQVLQKNLALAELLGDSITGHAIVTIALQRRIPGMPGDAATQLIDSFCNWRLSNGAHTNPDAATAWDVLQGLQRNREEQMAELAEFSAATPTPPPPPDPREQAAATIAQLYPADSNGQAASEPASTP